VTEGGILLIEVEGEGVESAVGSTQVETPSTHYEKYNCNF
jgi:hypothetical protein